MKKILFVFVAVGIIFLANPLYASNEWASGGWSIQDFDIPDFNNQSFSIDSTENSVDFVSNVTPSDPFSPPPYNGSFGVAYSNNSLSLNNNFRLDVNYHINTLYNFPRFLMTVGFYNEDISNPFYWDEYASVAPQDALYDSKNGSIRMQYDAVQDRLDYWITSKNPSDVEVENYVDAISNFKLKVGSDSVLVGFAQYNTAFDVSAGEAGFSDLKVVAAPEPVSSILFLTGAGLMGLSRLRKRMA